MLFALLACATPTPSVDGVYVDPPFAMPATQQVVTVKGGSLRVHAPHGPDREGTLTVTPRRLTVMLDGVSRTWTYRIVEGELWLGTAVRDGEVWRSLYGWTGDACTPETGCVVWNGDERVTAFGGTTALPAERDPDGILMTWSQSAGPVGLRIAGPPEPGLYWASGVPGLEVQPDGALVGLDDAPVYPWEGEPRGVQQGITWGHGPMGHGDGHGDVLWFGLPDGRLFVADRAGCCSLGRFPPRAVLSPVDGAR